MDGGSDDEDNLIPPCLICHASTHTKTRLTRNFTANELKQHRDEVYRLVAEGKLPAEEQADPLSRFSAAAAESVAREGGVALSELAVGLLVKAAAGDGGVLLSLGMPKRFTVRAGGENVLQVEDDPRAEAEHRHAVEELCDHGYLECRTRRSGADWLRVTHPGYLLADELIAAGTSTAQPRLGFPEADRPAIR